MNPRTGNILHLSKKSGTKNFSSQQHVLLNLTHWAFNISDITHFVYLLHLVKKSTRQEKKYVSAGGVETLSSIQASTNQQM